MTEDPDRILGQLPARLREARRARGLSLDAVAKLSGVSRSMVSQIERGESSPTIATLWNLTRALQVDFAGLLEDGPAEAGIEVIRADQTPGIDRRGELDAALAQIFGTPSKVERARAQIDLTLVSVLLLSRWHDRQLERLRCSQ